MRAIRAVVPDLPGCFSAGDTQDEALDNAREATLDDGGGLPKPTRIDDHIKRYRKWIPSIVEIDPVEVLGESERINISLPKRVLRRLDHRAALANQSRSACIAKLAMDES